MHGIQDPVYSALHPGAVIGLLADAGVGFDGQEMEVDVLGLGFEEVCADEVGFGGVGGGDEDEDVVFVVFVVVVG
jgi:hypothetical protein